MKPSSFAIYHGLGKCAAIAMLAGCASQPIESPPLNISKIAATVAPRAQKLQHPGVRKSWMSTDAAKIEKLLYVSDDDTNDVYVYNYETRESVGVLTGFDSPYGQCVDKVGDVYLTSSLGSTGSIIEYAHGGTTPIKTLGTDGHPIGCSIDPTSGNLAVDNGLPGGGSDIQVWKNAMGTPKDYANEQDCYEMWPPGYDNRGNLFVESEAQSHTVCELASGSTSLRTVSINKTIYYSGGVMWDGKDVALTDQSYNGGNITAIYRAKVTRKGNLTVVGKTLLRDSCGVDVIQPFIVGKHNTPVNDQRSTEVVGGNLGCYGASPVTYWRYPRGGRPVEHLHHSPRYVWGQSVSIRE